MANYSKSTNFAVKDSLTTGDPNKIVSGTEIDTEFNSLASMSSTKADKVGGAAENNVASLTASGNLKDSGVPINQLVPSGAVQYFAMDTEPSGWLKADGSAVSRSTYSSLFSAIGTTFGNGDGSSTFNLPDLRGEFLRGWDDGREIDDGRSFGSFQEDEIKSHTHSTNADRDFGLYGMPLSSVTTNPEGNDLRIGFRDASVNSTGGDETRPRNIALLACIKF
jgi:microcystin-dependent protein